MSESATSTPLLLAGRYRLSEKVGEVRLAAVYRATDESLQRHVLVHILRKDLVGQEALRQRFVAEISASAQRSHPALLEVFDSGEVEGAPFVVTDFVQGRPLRERGRLTAEDALLYMRQIVGAVAVCQASNLPHPPVSSSNVLLVSDGQVKLVESWLQSPADIPLDLAHYRAPELTEGHPPGPTSTVYALGVLFYELLTGRRPVQGQDVTEVARAHLNMRLPPLGRMQARLHLPRLDELLRRATVRQPQQRFPDVKSFAEALDATWRSFTADTQRLAVLPAPPLPQQGVLDILQQPAPVASPPPAPMRVAANAPGAAPVASPPPARASSGRAAPAAAPARGPDNQPARSSGDTMLRFVYPSHWQRQAGVSSLSAWIIVSALVLAVALGSYVGASYVANLIFNVQLPQLGLPQLGLPEINMPNVDLDVPDWLQPSAEEGEVLVVNINEGLNMRDRPGLSTNVVAIVPNGARVRKLEGPIVVDQVPWVRVRVEGNGQAVEGWMSLNFLKPAQ